MSRALIISWSLLFLLAAGAMTYVQTATQTPAALVTVSSASGEPIIAFLLAIVAIACLFVASRK